MHTPYISFVHNLICLSSRVYFAMVTTPTPLLDVSMAGSSRHTFLWFLGRRRRSQLSPVLMDVLTSASLSDSQWAARQCEASGNDEKCREAHKHSSRGLITRKPMASTSKLIGNLCLKHFVCLGYIFLEWTGRNAADANIVKLCKVLRH